MSIKLKVRTNPLPCEHTVITFTEDGVDRVTVFHNSDFENDNFVPDEDSREIFKIIKKQLKKLGKKLSESKKDFDKKIVTYDIEDEQ